MSTASRFARLLVLATPLVIGGTLLVAVVDHGTLEVQEASAKQHYESAYGFEQTWNAALRLVRVDLGMKVVDKDEKAGFIMFDYENDGKSSPGSFELLRTEKSIRVICQLPKVPSYHEIAVLDRLARKLKEEYGAPPEKKKPEPPPDAGPPDGGDETGGS
ncbi:MAG: hypothetical protein NVS3B10_24420 [Polyangiales bacterium]